MIGGAGIHGRSADTNLAEEMSKLLNKQVNVQNESLFRGSVMLQQVPPKLVPPDHPWQLQLVPPDHLQHCRWSPRTNDGAIVGPP